MKYLTFVVPCYNSSKYMKKCIDSIIPLGEDVEILIIDDGSNKDNTLEIAKKYEKKYPTICKAIHKKNGGHGDVLNTGIKYAKGLFMKVVDSDDWINTKAGKILLKNIKIQEIKESKVDLFITNYIYDKVGVKHKKRMSYGICMPKNKVIEWEQTFFFPLGKYLLMHSLTYRVSVLRKSKVILPKHTFYVDNIYAYKPLPYVKKFMYINVDLYHYFIGRSDQSVNEEIMISRLSQQYKVTKIMLYKVKLHEIKSLKLRFYMINYLSIVITITSILSIISRDKHWLNEKDKMWKELMKKDIVLYRELMYSFFGFFVNLPGKPGRIIVEEGYKIARSLYGFN